MNHIVYDGDERGRLGKVSRGAHRDLRKESLGDYYISANLRGQAGIIMLP